MNSKPIHFPHAPGAVSLWSALALALGLISASAQIFVENWDKRTISKYTMSGAVENATLIRLPPEGFGAVGMVVDGENHLFIADGAAGCLRKYTTSGAIVDETMVSGLDWSLGLALDGQGQLFVVNSGVFNSTNGTIGVYTTSGATINASLISGLRNPYAVAFDGNGHVYVASIGDGTIKKYTTMGALVDAALVTGLGGPRGLVCDGNGHLYVCNANSGTIGAYSTSGGVINATLVSGLDYPIALALGGNGDLFVANYFSGTVGQYTTDGNVVNASLVVAPGRIDGLAVAPAAPPPTLQISYTPNQVVLSWPVSASNFVLETTGTLLPTAGWLPLTNGVIADGSNFVLTNQATDSSAFYRLYQP